MTIRSAQEKDIATISKYDIHVSKEELYNLVQLKRVLIAEEDGDFVGWLRYNLFWDNTPFMNMLYLLDNYRGKGYGKQLVLYWEEEMSHQNYKTVMTSTASVEYAQHFYIKMGYKTVGGFIPKGESYEIILSKLI